MEGLHQVGAVRKKPVVEVHQSDKLTQLTLRLGLGKVTNSLNFPGQGSDTMLVDVMAEKIQFSNTKEALVGVDDNAMGGESFKNGSQIPEVLFRGGTRDEDVINVDVS